MATPVGSGSSADPFIVTVLVANTAPNGGNTAEPALFLNPCLLDTSANTSSNLTYIKFILRVIDGLNASDYHFVDKNWENSALKNIPYGLEFENPGGQGQESPFAFDDSLCNNTNIVMSDNETTGKGKTYQYSLNIQAPNSKILTFDPRIRDRD